MKKLLLIFIFSLFFIFNVKGQNLVPNGDFEQYLSCPTGYTQIDKAFPWMNPSVVTYGDPDYFNQCAIGFVNVPNSAMGYQNAHTGAGYSGLYLLLYNIPDDREYIESPLTSPLIAGVCYYFEMYVSLANISAYSSDNIGIYFSVGAVTGISSYNPLNFVPQINNTSGNFPDSLNWKLVSGTYTASGGESHIIIGNYLDDMNTDTLLSNSTGLLFSYIYIDDVSLTSCTGMEEQNENSAIKIYPNPVKDELFVSGYSLSGKEKAEIKIVDVLGKEVYRNVIETSSFKLQTSNYLPGIYFLEINDGKNIFRKKFLKQCP